MTTLYTKTALVKDNLVRLSNRCPQFYLKSEFSQPGGSFKSRGIGYLIQKNSQNLLNSHVFSSSGGNAGLAAATASKILNLPCTVVVPETTKKSMIDKIRERGATVIVNGSHWKEADSYLQNDIIDVAEKNGVSAIYVHPFDNPDIWEGHSSIVDEIVESFKSENISIDRVKGIVCSLGGGGLYNGIIRGLEKNNLADNIPVIAVETKGCDVFNASLKAGKPVRLDKITSVASSLGSVYIPQAVFENAIKYKSKSIVLEDLDVLDTCIKYGKEKKVVTEPACGAALHLMYHPDIFETNLGMKLEEDDIIVVIACGGSGMSSQEISDTMDNLRKLK